MNEGDAALDKQRSNQVEESSSSCTSSQRKPLANDEKKHIQEVFRDILRSNATITMQLVRETMKKEAKLIKLQEIEGMLKRVLDYLRNIQKNKPRQDLKELPVVQKSKQVETWLTSQAGPSSIATGTSNKQKWSDEDTDKIVEVFTQAFGPLKKVPPRGEVKQIFQQELAEILEKSGFQRCYNKVKHVVQLNSKKRKT